MVLVQIPEYFVDAKKNKKKKEVAVCFLGKEAQGVIN